MNSANPVACHKEEDAVGPSGMYEWLTLTWQVAMLAQGSLPHSLVST